ncbi:protein dek [Anaeramoeba flamelloides]|uniref:Protein dek n=1 Tax=Anaeramoeba flamelloides TaxID=1746091 RepID=A0AAV7YMH2_9EUKA|nr:protein dek [Anaeramoeba flamelloides]
MSRKRKNIQNGRKFGQIPFIKNRIGNYDQNEPLLTSLHKLLYQNVPENYDTLRQNVLNWEGFEKTNEELYIYFETKLYQWYLSYLKELCTFLNLKISGNKPQIVNRILGFLQSVDIRLMKKSNPLGGKRKKKPKTKLQKQKKKKISTKENFDENKIRRNNDSESENKSKIRDRSESENEKNELRVLTKLLEIQKENLDQNSNQSAKKKKIKKQIKKKLIQILKMKNFQDLTISQLEIQIAKEYKFDVQKKRDWFEKTLVKIIDNLIKSNNNFFDEII